MRPTLDSRAWACLVTSAILAPLTLLVAVVVERVAGSGWRGRGRGRVADCPPGRPPGRPPAPDCSVAFLLPVTVTPTPHQVPANHSHTRTIYFQRFFSTKKQCSALTVLLD